MAICTVSAVSAEDLNQTDIGVVDDSTAFYDNEVISLEENEKLNANNCSEVLYDTYYPTNFNDLESKVSSAKNGDTIILDGYYSFSRQIIVDKQLNFIGINNAKLDGRNANRLFRVNVDDVTFNNITFQNGRVDNDDGGALYTHYKMSIDNCKFINNYAGWSCGAIFIGSGSNYSISNSYFEGNSGEYGGAVSIRNGNNNTKGNIYNCTFYRNVGRYTYGAVEHANVEKCTFIENHANNGDAGAIGVFEHDFVIKDCNFIKNTATRNSGALHLGGPKNIHHNVINCYFEGNSADNYGGDIYSADSDVKILNCSFSNSHASYGGSIYFERNGATTVENCNFTNNRATDFYAKSGAINFMNNANVTNCNFINNSAEYNSGAIEFESAGIVTNCNFSDNTARFYGGAVTFGSDGEVKNCNFTNNSASFGGGAIYFWRNGNTHDITNCNFINNKATGNSAEGGAIYFSRMGNVTNCKFINNQAEDESGAIFSNKMSWVRVDSCIFKTSSDTAYRTRYFLPTLNIDKSTSYKSGDNLSFDFKTNSGMIIDNGNITISVYHKNNNSWVGDYSCLSSKGWIIDLPVGYYYAIFNTEYTRFQPINKEITVLPNIEYYITITPVTTTSKTVNIAAKSNIPNDIVQGKLVFILPDGSKISANYNADGTWWATYTFNNYGKYNINAQYTGLNGVTINKATIDVKDTSKTTPKITAKNKAFKTKTKTKKYTATLKDNQGKPIKNTKLTLKVKGKTYKATTNSKGKATFKIKKLNKKGKYKATITYKGNANYNKTTKKVKITVK